MREEAVDRLTERSDIFEIDLGTQNANAFLDVASRIGDACINPILESNKCLES